MSGQRGVLALAAAGVAAAVWRALQPVRRPTILLIRHGETDGNRTRTVQVPSTPLSEKGLHQASLLALRLAPAPLCRLLSSDLARAHMTAEAIARLKPELTIEVEPGLAERNFGDWRGQKYDALKARGIEVMGKDGAPPNGETWEVFHARVAEVWGRMAQLAEGAEGPIALVCHGLTARSILTHHVDSKGKKLNLGCSPSSCTPTHPHDLERH